MSNSNELTAPVPKGGLPETPKGQRFTTRGLGIEGTPHSPGERAGALALDQIREKIAREMNAETLLCHIDKFLGHFGPSTSVKPADVPKCRKFLVKANVLNEETGRWTLFPLNPLQYPEQEHIVFKSFKPIIDKILQFAGNRRGNSYKFEVVDHTYLDSDIPGGNHKMDGCLVDGDFKIGKEFIKISVRRIKSPHQYKKRRTQEDQRIVHAQVVSDCYHILCEDPRHMFIFAVTVEDTFMSVWYFSRSHGMKVLSVDWAEKDIDTFIHVILAFAFASPEQLGVDPTVHLTPIKTNEDEEEAAAQHYIYQCPVEAGADGSQDVPDAVKRSKQLAAPKFKYFMTVRSINDMRTYNISEQNTRVWKAVEVKGPNTTETVRGEYFVLKDVWLDRERLTEAENMDNIFRAIDELVNNSKNAWGDAWKEHLVAEDARFGSFDDATKARLQRLLTNGNYKSLFLAKLDAWTGVESKPLSPEVLNNAGGVDILPGASVTEKPGHVSRTAQGSLFGNSSHATTAVNSANSPVALDQKTAEDRKKRRRFAPKQQSRFVYKEVCNDLASVGTLGKFMDLIEQSLDALRVLFCARWVHRDISSSNLLAFDHNGKWEIKLADLEFAKKVDREKSLSDPRTGTPFYMPFEIMDQVHLLNDLREEVDPEMSMAKQLGLVEGTAQYECYKSFSQFGTCIQRLPSTARIQDIPDAKTAIRYNFQHDLESIWWIVLHFITALVNHSDSQRYATLVFQHSLTASKSRWRVFEKKFKVTVEEHLHETLKVTFPAFMEKLRSSMYKEYLERELFGQLAVDESYSAIHSHFATHFRRFLEAANTEGEWKQMAIAPNGVFTGPQVAGCSLNHD